MVDGVRPRPPGILGQPAPVGADFNCRIFEADAMLVVTEPHHTYVFFRSTRDLFWTGVRASDQSRCSVLH